jgi:cytochrome c oxidase assembly protein subunit 19
MKKVKGLNDPACRNLAKSYLACRMDRWVSSKSPIVFAHSEANSNSHRNLMAKDEFKNLGFADEKPVEQKEDDAAGKVHKPEKSELKW